MCRLAGQSRRGFPSCGDTADGRCNEPPLELTLHEQAALAVFRECYEANQWNFVGGDMGPARKVSLKYDFAERVAESYGIAWTPVFRARVTDCARAFLEYDAKVLAAQLENEKFQREATVN